MSTIDFSDGSDKARHDQMVQLVAARAEGEQNFHESKCATLDRQINDLVGFAQKVGS